MLHVWNDLDRTLDELDRLVRATGPRRAARARVVADTPRLRVREDEAGWDLSTDLPGVAAADVQVELKGGTLHLRARRDPAPPEGHRAVRRERGTWTLDRTLRLPDAVDPRGVTARHVDGRLTVHLPRRAAEADRTVTVETE